MMVPLLVVMASNTQALTAAPAAQGSAQTFTITAGRAFASQAGEKSDWYAHKFYMDNVTINVGDSVLWKQNSEAEPHTVTFLGADKKIPETPLIEEPAGGQGPPTITENPLHFFKQGGDTYDGQAYTNSGFMSSEIPGPKEYRLTFPTAGTFQYLCLLHASPSEDGSLQGMVGTVTVQAAGSAYPKTPAQVMADADAMIQADLQKTATFKSEIDKLHTTQPGPNGTTIHHIKAGFFSPPDGLEYLRFVPREAMIMVGDTVEWTSMGFHTVTFGGEPELILVQPQPQGPPKAVYNPEVIFPVGESNYGGTGYNNSGLLVPGPLPPEAPPILGEKHTLTFTQPGRFEYICVTHYDMGMDATITVQARTGAEQPGMPTTGGNNWLPFLILGLGMTLTLAGLSLRLRKSPKAL